MIVYVLKKFKEDEVKVFDDVVKKAKHVKKSDKIFYNKEYRTIDRINKNCNGLISFILVIKE